jgi:hypothetical protein
VDGFVFITVFEGLGSGTKEGFGYGFVFITVFEGFGSSTEEGFGDGFEGFSADEDEVWIDF